MVIELGDGRRRRGAFELGELRAIVGDLPNQIPASKNGGCQRQPDIAQGINPATMPGAMTNKQNVPTIAAVLFIRSFHLHGPAVRRRQVNG
jgi:hypothetical protein